MMVQKNSAKKLIKQVISFCVMLSLAGTLNVFGQDDADSTKKLLFASAHTKNETVYIVKQANVIYPDILTGSEAVALNYVANFSNKKKEYLINMYTKAKKVLPKVNAILKQCGMPQELGVLMLLESGCNANAVSKAGAVGYWQIMDEVAKDYGLKYVPNNSIVKNKNGHAGTLISSSLSKVNSKQKDDRKNFYKSTVAAAHYLRDRRANLDSNWLLVVASYNCGIGKVWNAIKKKP